MDPNDPMARSDTALSPTADPSDDLTPAAEPGVKPTVIDLFGDTGHHFAFVPLTSRQLSDNPDIEKLCRNNDFPWCEARDRSGEPLRWLRYQFAQREVAGMPTDQSGLLLGHRDQPGHRSPRLGVAAGRSRVQHRCRPLHRRR